MWTVSKEFRFESAHSLPHLPEGHKCRNVHGHSYKVVIVCSGCLNIANAWVIDYADISAAVKPLVDLLDHQDLNRILDGPTTAENLAYWFWCGLHLDLPMESVQIWETPTTCCTYRAPK